METVLQQEHKRHFWTLYLSAGQRASSSCEGNNWSSFHWSTRFHPANTMAA